MDESQGEFVNRIGHLQQLACRAAGTFESP